MSVIVAPSRFHCWLLVLPWAPKLACWPEALPPTFCTLITMPGVCSRMTHGSRADGMASSSSLPKLVPSVFERVSMIGLSPVTVTVSCDARQLELAVDFGIEAGLDAHVGPHHPLEAGQLERHRVDADAQVREAIGPAGGGNRRLGLNERRAGQDDRRAR